MTNFNLIWLPKFKAIHDYQGPYKDYLFAELEALHCQVDIEMVSASKCLQGVMAELVLFGEVKFDWISVLDSLLIKDSKSLAYSEKYANHLHGFAGQWEQFSINAAYSQFWIRKTLEYPAIDFQYLERKQQATGVFFDEDISPTIVRHRMKSEIAASTAMVLEINSHQTFLSDIKPELVLSALDDLMLFPRYRYLSLEYFRSHILNSLSQAHFDFEQIRIFLEKCSMETPMGWSDFIMEEKRGPYMGTASRSGRDSNIHSPLLANFASELMLSAPTSADFEQRMSDYIDHLNSYPFEIPAFKMRDLPYDFGPGLTMLESMAAIALTESVAT